MNEIISENLQKKCVFLSNDFEKVNNVEKLLKNNNYEYEKIIENKNKNEIIEYSIIVNSNNYNEICDIIEGNINIINEKENTKVSFFGMLYDKDYFDLKKPYNVATIFSLLSIYIIFLLLIILATRN
ncbi:MAG: hypothetical protein FWD47_05345 [Treponema sp.]|nr:hypothetical protein [Treponema sp.]